MKQVVKLTSKELCQAIADWLYKKKLVPKDAKGIQVQYDRWKNEIEVTFT